MIGEGLLFRDCLFRVLHNGASITFCKSASSNDTICHMSIGGYAMKAGGQNAEYAFFNVLAYTVYFLKEDDDASSK